MAQVLTLLDLKYLPKDRQKKIEFLQALYEFIEYCDPHLSVDENLKLQIEKSDKILLTPLDTSIMALDGVERDADYHNLVFNKKKRVEFLHQNLDAYQELLSLILINSDYRDKLKPQLEEEIWEKPGFFSRLMDTFVRLSGSHLGWYRSKEDDLR